MSWTKKRQTLHYSLEGDSQRRNTIWDQQGEPNIHTFTRKRKVDDMNHTHYTVQDYMESEPRPGGPESSWVFLSSQAEIGFHQKQIGKLIFFTWLARKPGCITALQAWVLKGFRLFVYIFFSLLCHSQIWNI